MADVASTSQRPTGTGAEPRPGGHASPPPTWAVSPAVGAKSSFFETPPNPKAKRRMLLVFFSFAPSAEVGALRWISLARFGAERGWALDVVGLQPRDMGPIDATRLSQLPPGMRLFGFSGEDPLWYRGLVGAWRRLQGGNNNAARPVLGGHLDGNNLPGTWPAAADAPAWRRSFRSWLLVTLGDGLAVRGAQLGKELARSTHYDVVLSSGPPHAAHEAARAIADAVGVPFVMDMRDPWSDDSAMPEELRSSAWQRATRSREDRCVAAADRVVVTSAAHEALQIQKYPFLHDRLTTVMNGADTDPLPLTRLGRRFLVAFAGKIYLGRNPRALFRAAARVARETSARPEELGVEFMGDDACDGVPLSTISAEEGLGDHFKAHGFRPRSEALEFLSSAAVLVSLPLRTTMTLPAKLFEYMRFDAWLLALAESGSATAELLSGTGADVVGPEDEVAIARVLRARFEEFRAGRRPVALNRDGRFNRSVQATHMFDLLDQVAEAGRGRARTR